MTHKKRVGKILKTLNIERDDIMERADKIARVERMLEKHDAFVRALNTIVEMGQIISGYRVQHATRSRACLVPETKNGRDTRCELCRHADAVLVRRGRKNP